MFVYDPQRRTMTRLADVLSQVEHADGDWGYGKIHAPLVAGRCGEVYLSTYWGSRKGLEYSGTYEGDLLFRLDPSTLELEPLGVPVPRHGIPSLAGSAADQPPLRRGHRPGGPRRSRPWCLLRLRRRRARRSCSAPTARTTSGSATSSSAPTGRRTSPARVVVSSCASPAATTCGSCPTSSRAGDGCGRPRGPGPDGTVYGVTHDPDRFFALHADGRVADLGEARDYAASLALHPDGTRFFYVPGAHGKGNQQGTPLVSVDTATGEQKVVAELNPLVRARARPDRRGELRRRGRPVGRSGVRRAQRSPRGGSDETFGEVALAIVHLSDGSGAEQAGDGDAAAPCYGRPEPVRAATSSSTTRRTLGAGRAADGDVRPRGCGRRRQRRRLDRPVRRASSPTARHGSTSDRGAEGPAPDRLLLGGPDGFRVDDAFPGGRAGARAGPRSPTSTATATSTW